MKAAELADEIGAPRRFPAKKDTARDEGLRAPSRKPAGGYSLTNLATVSVLDVTEAVWKGLHTTCCVSRTIVQGGPCERHRAMGAGGALDPAGRARRHLPAVLEATP